MSSSSENSGPPVMSDPNVSTMTTSKVTMTQTGRESTPGCIHPMGGRKGGCFVNYVSASTPTVIHLF